MFDLLSNSLIESFSKPGKLFHRSLQRARGQVQSSTKKTGKALDKSSGKETNMRKPTRNCFLFFWFLSACFLLWHVCSDRVGGLELSPRTLNPKVLGWLPYSLFFPLLQEHYQQKPTKTYAPPLLQKKTLRPKLKPVFSVTLVKDAKSKQEQLFRWSPGCSCSLFLSHHFLIHVTVSFQYDLILFAC